MMNVQQKIEEVLQCSLARSCLKEQCKFCKQTRSNKITDVFLVFNNRNNFKIADIQELAVTNKIALYDIQEPIKLGFV